MIIDSQKIRIAIKSIVNRLTGKTNVHFLHIGKTGGTAIKEALLDIVPKKHFIFLHKHNVSLQDIPNGDKIFFVLRDPITRFVSGFNSRQRQGQPRYFYPWSDNEKIAFANFTTANTLAESLNSSSADIKYKAECAMRSITHVKSSFYNWVISDEYFAQRKNDILFVGFQERLDLDFDKLKTALNLPSLVSLSSDPVKKHASLDNQDVFLSELAIDNLTKWYKKDIDFYNYCKSLYK